jgi:hypothetical protein
MATTRGNVVAGRVRRRVVTMVDAVREGSREVVREGRRGRRGAAERACGASGWPMRSGCTDGDGGAICPICGRSVRTVPHEAVRHGVAVIEAHGA